MERDKRPKTLAPEALACWMDSFSVHHPLTRVDIALGEASGKVRKFDPTGKKGLAVLREMESPSQT